MRSTAVNHQGKDTFWPHIWRLLFSACPFLQSAVSTTNTVFLFCRMSPECLWWRIHRFSDHVCVCVSERREPSASLKVLTLSCGLCVALAGLVLASLLLSSLCGGAAAMFDSQLDVHWELWKKTHEKTYQNEVWDVNMRARPKYICMIYQYPVECLTLRTLCVSWGGGYEPQGIVGEKPEAHYHAQPGGLDGTSHLRTEHEPPGRLGETLAHSENMIIDSWFFINGHRFKDGGAEQMRSLNFYRW